MGYVVNSSLRGEMPVKTKENDVCAGGGRDSNSLYDSKFATHSESTIT